MNLPEDMGSPVDPPRKGFINFSERLRENDEYLTEWEKDCAELESQSLDQAIKALEIQLRMYEPEYLDPDNLTEVLLSALQIAELKDGCVNDKLLHLFEKVKCHLSKPNYNSMRGGEDFSKAESDEPIFKRFNDPATWRAIRMRGLLKTVVGNYFNTIAYRVINLIPDPDWMEFARNALKVDEETEQIITESSSCTRDTKFRMMKHWQKTMTETGQDASAEKLFDLAVDFLETKGAISQIILAATFAVMAYKVIDMIPDPKWKEFARTKLEVDEYIAQLITGGRALTQDMKYMMVKHWQQMMTRTEQDGSAEKLQDLTNGFLTEKGPKSRMVQQNFNGPINCQTFNAYSVNNK